MGIIEFRSVSYVYPNGVRALSGIDLTISSGEFVFLSGASGAGKSTLLKLVHGQLNPTMGEVCVGKQNIGMLSNRKIADLRRRIGFVFQDFKLLENRSVFENVAYVLEVVGARQKEIQKKVSRALNLVGLTHKTYKKIEHLSCGEQQRAAIARAIVNSPEILLADEPTCQMDESAGWEIIQFFQKIQQSGITVAMATHNSKWADRLGKRIVFLDGGKIIEEELEKGAQTIGISHASLLRA